MFDHEYTNRQIAQCLHSFTGFVPGTLVLTDQGRKPINEIMIGDRVISRQGSDAEPSYSSVKRVHSFKEAVIWVIKLAIEVPGQLGRDALVYHLYVAENHPLLVEGLGWCPARYLKDTHRLILANDRRAEVMQAWPVIRTPLQGVGWVSADTLGNYDGLERAHVVDFRNGCNLWRYPRRNRDEAGVPYFEGMFFDRSKSPFDAGDLIAIYEGSDDPSFRWQVINLELEHGGDYFVGELDVGAHTFRSTNAVFFNEDRAPEVRAAGLIAGTLVHTENGPKPVEQLVVGDRVLSHFPEAKESALGQVQKVDIETNQDIWVVKLSSFGYRRVSYDPVMVRHIYTAADQGFWVVGVGWVPASGLQELQYVRLMDGGISMVLSVWPVSRTPIPGVAWVPQDTMQRRGGPESAHIVDFNRTCTLWEYPLLIPDGISVPYREGLAFDPIEGWFDGQTEALILKSDDSSFKANLYKLRISTSGALYAGSLGACTLATDVTKS